MTNYLAPKYPLLCLLLTVMASAAVRGAEAEFPPHLVQARLVLDNSKPSPDAQP